MSHDSAAWLCANCGASIDSAFCGACGEKRFDRHDLSLGHFFEHTFEAFVHFDHSILRTLRALVIQPGRLTADWTAGRRKSFHPPVQLFLLMNVLYFVATALNGWNTLATNLDTHISWTDHQELAKSMVDGKLAARGITLKEYRPVFDAKSTIQAKSLVILMVPEFALPFGFDFTDYGRA